MNVPILTGTLPIRPYHPTQFFGTIKADGQLPKVAALACHHQEVVAISLVGYDTSVSAALARLWQREQLAFEPDPAIDWHGPQQLGRRQENYKQFHATLPGTKEVHVLALPVSANIAEGMLHPPDIPKPKQEQESSSRLSSRRRWIARASSWATGMKPHRICAVSWGICMPCV